jgi:cysteine desulfurase / selenocysteine lyase
MGRELPMASALPLSTSPSLETDPWGWWRAQMPITHRWAYFDHAAVAPLPTGAADAVVKYSQQASQDGDTRWPEWSASNESLRSDFASLLNCKTSEIALIPNTSFGINAVAEGIDWKAGDNIVIPAGEFPSNRFPWLNQQRHGVEVRIVGDDDSQQVDEAGIIEAIDNRTRLVAASWVGYASGYRINVERMVDEVHRRGALFFLDAIQGLGIYSLDLAQTPVDFLAADGHKWLLGPEGAGVLMIRESHLSKLACVPVGWNSVRAAHHFSHASFDIRPAASRYEIGSQTMVGMAALRASLALFSQVIDVHGSHAIGERILSLCERLEEQLRALGASIAGVRDRERRSGIVTFSIPGIEASSLRQAALESGVVVSCRGIGVRASVHAYNNEADIDRLVHVGRAQIEKQSHLPVG